MSTTPTAVLSLANEAWAPSKNCQKKFIAFPSSDLSEMGEEAGFKTTLQKGFPAHPYCIPSLHWFFLPQMPLSQCSRKATFFLEAIPSGRTFLLSPSSFLGGLTLLTVPVFPPLGQLSRARTTPAPWLGH